MHRAEASMVVCSKAMLHVAAVMDEVAHFDKVGVSFGAIAVGAGFDPWLPVLLSLVVFVLGHAWFYKLRKSFADMI